MSKNLSELSGRKGLDQNLFEAIGIAAGENGTPSEADMERLAKEFLIGTANVYGAASFYDFTRAANKGKKAYVCNGSACLTAGTQDKVHAELAKHMDADAIGEMCCMGRCHENAAFNVGGENYSGLDLQNVESIVKGEGKSAETYNQAVLGEPLLMAAFPGIDPYYATLKDALKRSPEELLKEIEIANVRGRGGAGFPMAFKLNACRIEENDTKFIVCNADEGDPGAYSDRYLLEERPHSVLLGMLLSGYITGANWGVLYIRAEYPRSVQVVQKAIDELHAAGYLGENILGTDFSYDFKIIKAQGSYVCGEETALLSSIEGQRPEVRVRPPYPAQKGLFNKPTIVNNVETLACVPYIIANGGEAYAALGTERSKGTKLVSLDSWVNNPGIYEVEMGTPLRTVIDELGGGLKPDVKALHIGGPLGGIVPVTKIDELSIDFESFQQGGFLLGHASVVGIPKKFSMVKYAEHLFEFTAHESCGKCFPCRLGSKRGAELLEKAQTQSYKIDRELFGDLLDTLEQGSLCALGGGLPLPVRNALEYFPEEFNPIFNA